MGAGDELSHALRGVFVGRIGDDVVFAPAAPMTGGDLAGWSCDSDFFQAGTHGYEPVDECRIDTVLVGVDGDVVVAWQTHRRTDPDRWGIRRKWTHGLLVGVKPVSYTHLTLPTKA